MKIRITVTNEFTIDPKWIDEDGNLTHINDPAQVGGAKPLQKPGPVVDVLQRLLHRPYFVAGATPAPSAPWRVKVEEI
jgi:hypothetical protein